MNLNFTCKLTNGEIMSDEFCLEIKHNENIIIILFRNWLSMISGLYGMKIVSSEYKIK